MAPKAKGAKVKTKGQAKAVADAASVELKRFSVELAQGEKDHANLTYISKVHEAVEKIKDHQCFSMIDQSHSLAIAAGGSLSPFDLKNFNCH